MSNIEFKRKKQFVLLRIRAIPTIFIKTEYRNVDSLDEETLILSLVNIFVVIKTKNNR